MVAGGNLHIELFEQLNSGTYLMNVEELNITHSSGSGANLFTSTSCTYRSIGLPPTGLYPEHPATQEIVERKATLQKEYGLFWRTSFACALSMMTAPLCLMES